MRIYSPSITGSSNVTGSLFLTGSLFVTSTDNDIFLIRNQNNIPVLIVSQSGVVVLSTQSMDPTDVAPNGGFLFTSSSLFIGLE